MSIIIAMLSNAQRFQNGSMLLTHFEFTVASLTMAWVVLGWETAWELLVLLAWVRGCLEVREGGCIR